MSAIPVCDTTSTKEAELLDMEHEECFTTERLFRDIQLELNNGLKSHCDNAIILRRSASLLRTTSAYKRYYDM
jgi:hypothetical protein